MNQSHKTVDLGFIPYHFFRFWLWLTTGTITKEWVAIHRKHHAKCETEDDPHSPVAKGFNVVMWQGALLYRKEAQNKETLERYGKNTPDDWLEKNVYTPHSLLGLGLMLIIDVVLFGWAGLLVWLTQILWIPFWAAGVINGVGHYFGYRNWSTDDASRNIIPIGIIIGGEELHNNHHAFAPSAKLSNKWYEFDIGWMYIRILEILRMAKVRKVAPKIHINSEKLMVDVDTSRVVLANRMHVLSDYARQVMYPLIKSELSKSIGYGRKQSKLARELLHHSYQPDTATKVKLQLMLAESQALETVYQAQIRLKQLWENTSHNQELRLKALQEWIHHAETSNIDMLVKFARNLKGYTMA